MKISVVILFVLLLCQFLNAQTTVNELDKEWNNETKGKLSRIKFRGQDINPIWYYKVDSSISVFNYRKRYGKSDSISFIRFTFKQDKLFRVFYEHAISRKHKFKHGAVTLYLDGDKVIARENIRDDILIPEISSLLAQAQELLNTAKILLLQRLR